MRCVVILIGAALAACSDDGDLILEQRVSLDISARSATGASVSRDVSAGRNCTAFLPNLTQADLTEVHTFIIENTSFYEIGSKTLTLKTRTIDPRLKVSFGREMLLTDGARSGVTVEFMGNPPSDGEYKASIYGTNDAGAETQNDVTITITITGCASTTSPGACPVGDILFEWIPNSGQVVGGIRSFADLGGGDTCRAVEWVMTGAQDYPAVSPLTGEIAYVAASPVTNNRGIYVVPIFAGGRRTVDENDQQDENYFFRAISPTSEYRDLAWSPDGKWIACTELTGGLTSILLISVASPGTTISIPGSGFDRHPTWTAGRIYFVYNKQDLMFVDVTPNSGTLSVTQPALLDMSPNVPDGLLAPACSPDGTKIAFISYEDVGGFEFKKRLRILDVTDPAGHTALGTRNSPQDEDDEPAWWHDGTIVFSRFVFTGPNPRQGRFSLFQVRTDGSGLAEIFGPLGQPLDGGATRPAIVPAALR